MKRGVSPRDLARAGLMTALIAVCTHLSIPLPGGGPLNLQTFAVALGGFLLGPVYGVLSAAAYLLLGAAGLPVFSGFTGGVGRLFGPTGGFLWGFLLLAAGCGLGKGKRFPIALCLGLAGLILCHLPGAAWYARCAGVGFVPAALGVSIPFLPKDAASLALALVLAGALEKRKAVRG